MLKKLIKEWWPKLQCRLFGHKRGQRANDMALETGKTWYRCPRCQATWKRRAKSA